MAQTTINANLIPELWVAKIQKEGETAHWFNKLTAKDGSMPIHKNTELVSKKGTTITFGLKMELTGNGVTGNTTLRGAEEALVVHDFSVTIDQIRQGVQSTEWDTKKPVYEQWPEIKDALVTWFANWQDKTLITKLTASPTGTSSSGEWMSAASAGTEVAITASDKLTTALISKAKRRAKKHSPKVQPFNIDGGEYYCMLVSLEAARDLRTDSNWISAQQYAGPRDKSNPIFNGMMGVWDGVVVYEWERVSVTATGASSALVSHNLLLGKQAACYAVGREMWPIKDSTDYENVLGQGVAFWGGIAKTVYNEKDYGIIQVLTGGAAD
jgi:N4-gp56 family major capsid protein